MPYTSHSVCVTRRDTCLVDSTKGFKIIKVVDFLKFQDISILPVGVSVIMIKHNCLLMVTSNLRPKLDLDYITSPISLDSLEEAVHLLSVLHIAEDLLPYRLIDEVVIMCIFGKVYWLIAPHH